MSEYIRKVQYHETDKMGVTHHSNYIKWLEEARVELLAEIGLPYEEMEKRGIISPVVGLEIKYRRPTTFGDTVVITTTVKKYNGIRLEFAYTVKNAKDGETVAEATSSHCFMFDGKVVPIMRQFPDVDAVFTSKLETLR